ncbi:unnamed protein product [Rotaria socialis]|uniref:Phospholipase A2 n=1 Tax=Rotaria socialis TaxID=392032 RepID=A0A821ECK5_9BILA|nr:unnamed protein product [Rotaria socialis]
MKMIASRMWLMVIMGFYLSIGKIDSSNMNLIQFSNMINHKGFSSSDYYGYGCWCGWGNYGYKHLDDTDYCCKTHDEHYDWLENAGCNPKWVSYDWTGRSGGEIICNDTPGTCDRRACEVDKSAVDCFESHRRTYDTEYLQLSGKEKRRLCNSPTPRNFAR